MNILEWGALLDKAGNILNTTIPATQLKKKNLLTEQKQRLQVFTGLEEPAHIESPHMLILANKTKMDQS